MEMPFYLKYAINFLVCLYTANYILGRNPRSQKPWYLHEHHYTVCNAPLSVDHAANAVSYIVLSAW